MTMTLIDTKKTKIKELSYTVSKITSSTIRFVARVIRDFVASFLAVSYHKLFFMKVPYVLL